MSSAAGTRSTARERLAVLVLFSLLTVAMTWPQIAEPFGVLEHRDSWFNMWRLAWVAHQLPRDPGALFNANIYYPASDTLAYSDAILLPALTAAPLIWAGVPVAIVHTAMVLGTFMFAGIATYVLVRRLTGSPWAATFGGVIFAFVPYRFDHYMHLELLWTGWVPVCLLLVHVMVETGRAKTGVWAGLAFTALALSSIYYAVYLFTVLVPFTCVLALGARAVSARRLVVSGLAAALTAALLVTPYMLPYQRARAAVGERSANEAVLYSAGPTHYLAPMPGSLLYPGLAERFGRPEKRLFPGFIAGLLALTALWPRRGARSLPYVAGLVCAVDLSFGPAGLTYGWLTDAVPVFKGLRAPARAGGIALLMMAVLAGFGWAHLERQLREGWPRRSAGVLILLLVCAEYAGSGLRLVAAPATAGPLQAWLAAQPRGGVLELPLPDSRNLPGQDPEFAYLSTFHWQPMLNGYSGNVPPHYMRLLRTLETAGAVDLSAQLRTAGVRYIVVHTGHPADSPHAAWLARLEEQPALRRHGPFASSLGSAVVYDIASVHD